MFKDWKSLQIGNYQLKKLVRASDGLILFQKDSKPRPEPLTKPFCFTALEENSTFELARSSTDAINLVFETSPTGNYGSWTSFTYGDVRTLSKVGDKLYIRTQVNKNQLNNINAYSFFKMSGKIMASGNINSLLNQHFDSTNVQYTTHTFYRLFNNCISLIELDQLPDQDVLGISSYSFAYMFYGCSGLVKAPVLKYKTLKNSCYQRMFSGCKSLTTLPDIQAETLDIQCFQQAFSGCTGLQEIPKGTLKCETLADNCYQGMFTNCTGLRKAEIGAKTLSKSSLQLMFMGCSNLSDITVHFTDWNSDITATASWLLRVASNGTFRCPSALPDIRGNSNIPKNWTKVDI